MEKIYPSRREAETISPVGDIFLSIDEIIPSHIRQIMTNLNQYRRKSRVAQQGLEHHRADWQTARLHSTRQSYGNELDILVSERSKSSCERIQDIAVSNAVIAVEGLYENASKYNGAKDAIRSTANKASSWLVDHMHESQKIDIGMHEYQKIRGPHEYMFLTRQDEQEHDHTATIYNWGGEVDGQQYRHANFNDQIVLLSDIIVHCRATDQHEN
jgi:hypothetical protein